MTAELERARGLSLRMWGKQVRVKSIRKTKGEEAR